MTRFYFEIFVAEYYPKQIWVTDYRYNHKLKKYVLQRIRPHKIKEQNDPTSTISVSKI